MKRIITFVILAAIVGIVVGSQAYAKIALPTMSEKVLDNGLKVVVIENQEQPVVSMRLLIKSGTASDGKGKAGLAGLTAELLRKGTTTRDATKISEEIDFVGGRLGAGADLDASNVTAEVLTKHIDVGLTLLADIVLNPTFAEPEIERLRKQTIAGLMQQKDNGGAIADEQFAQYLFGENPYGQPGSGTVESVSSLTRDDIVAFWRANYVPSNAVLFVAGDIKAADALPKVEAKLGGWPKGTAPKLDVVPAQKANGTRVILINKADATQANIKMGHLGIDRYNPDIYSVRIMNYILGGGGFRSRLMDDIRDKRGLTYGISSQYSFDRYQGEFSVTVSTRTDSTAQAIAATIEHLKQIRQSDVTPAELKETISFYSGYFPRQFETPEQVANQLSIVELYGLDKDYIGKYIDNTAAVTVPAVRAAAEKYIDPNNLLIVVVGKADDLRQQLKQLGPVTELAIMEL